LLPVLLSLRQENSTNKIMPYTEQDAQNLIRKVQRYQEVLENTRLYRESWNKGLKKHITEHLQELAKLGGLMATVEARTDIQNLEAVVLTLGAVESGLGEPVVEGLHRDLIKHRGSLVYQQLFNGKILVLINYPYIEKYGEPQPPKTIAIYRPEELKEPYFIRHVENFVTEMTAWEDYDDDVMPDPNQRIGFKMNFEEAEK